MALEYLLFNEEKSGAFVRIWSDRTMSFTFQDYFYIEGELRTLTPQEAEADSRMQGFTACGTQVELTDKNSVFTTIRYDSGKLIDISARTTELVSVNPRRAFKFWLELSQALREHPETADKVKRNLETIAQITSLEEHFRQLKEQKVEVDFHQDYLRRIRPGIAADYA